MRHGLAGAPANQCLRVTVCIQTNWLVPASNSRATSDAPQNTPSKPGHPAVSVTRVNSLGLPKGQGAGEVAAA